MKLVSAVVPVFNEEANLHELIERCLAVGEQLDESFELVLVDDGSRDASVKIINAASAAHPGVVIGVLLKRNYGQHSAVMAGFAEARGDLIITLDADLQNPPEEMPKLVDKYHEGCDVVGSVRMDRQDSLFRRLASRLINAAARKATGVMMHDYGCMLRAYDRSIVEAMLNTRERSTFIPVLANSFASHSGEVDVAHSERSNDESKYGIWQLINLQFDLLTTMTTAPLRFLSVIGGGLAVLGFAFAILLLVTRVIYGAEWAGEGIFTIFAVLFVFIGIQLMGLGLVGEYIGRIYHDVRGRPRYVLREVVGRVD
jgi:undecaprenyl-phosphate 4-deoxy-4-formamido-L-arabinose transferase